MGAGTQSFDVHEHMSRHNITLVAPSSTTVGAYGGYMQGGGFSILASNFGLMTDQVLALEVVTADGKFVHADPNENEDLFWALRGGAGSRHSLLKAICHN